MGNGPSKRSRPRGQFGDFTVDNKSSLAGQSSSYQSAPPPPYTFSATSPMAVTNLESTHSPLGSRHTKLSTIPRPTSPATKAAYLRAPLRAESLEDALETLRQYDTIILMDDSTSMAGSLWKEVQQSLGSLIVSAKITFLCRQKRLWPRWPT
jgi:hypothetical protein